GCAARGDAAAREAGARRAGHRGPAPVHGVRVHRRTRIGVREGIRTLTDTTNAPFGALPSFGTRTIGRRTFDFDRQVAVMAVVNRTPDSFYDKGATFALDRAVEASLAAAAQGADW